MLLFSVLFVLSLAICVSFPFHYLRRRYSRLPPGPLGLPFIGNLLDMAAVLQPDKLASLKEKYGESFPALDSNLY